MYIIKDNQFVKEKNNPYWCDNLGEPCYSECTVIGQENKVKDNRCRYYNNPSVSSQNNPRKHNYNDFWNNRYYEGLGSYSTVGKTTSRLSLLRKELNVIDRRTKWDEVNPRLAKSYLEKLIIKEERK